MKKTETIKEKVHREKTGGFRPGGFYRRYCIGTTLLNLASAPVTLMTAEMLSDAADAAAGGDFPAALPSAVVAAISVAVYLAFLTWHSLPVAGTMLTGFSGEVNVDGAARQIA